MNGREPSFRNLKKRQQWQIQQAVRSPTYTHISYSTNVSHLLRCHRPVAMGTRTLQSPLPSPPCSILFFFLLYYYSYSAVFGARNPAPRPTSADDAISTAAGQRNRRASDVEGPLSGRKDEAHDVEVQCCHLLR